MAFNSFHASNQTKNLTRASPVRVVSTLRGPHPHHGEGERWAVHPDDYKRHFAGHVATPATQAEKMEKAIADFRGVSFAKGGSDDAEYRWITVHPHGSDEKGVPIRIRKMHDGAWGVINGAGGKLNGLRLTGVKSPEEYKAEAGARAKERAEKNKAKEVGALHTLHEKHFEALHSEHLAKVEKGEIPTPASDEEAQKAEDALHLEAGKRAVEERRQVRNSQDNDLDAAKDVKRERQQQLIEHAAGALGWKPEDYQLSEADVKAIHDNQFQQACEADPTLAEKAYRQGDEKAVAKIAKSADKGVQRVLDAHQKLVLKRAREGLANHKEIILAATDDLAGEDLGDVAAGDLVRKTLGDAGKGFVAHLEDEAAARGLDTRGARAGAADVNWQSRLERKDFDAGAAMKAQAAVELMQAKATEARESLKSDMKKLGEGENSPLSRVAALNTTPTAKPGEAAKVLVGAKAIESGISEAKTVERQIKGADPLDTLPKAAVLRSSAELSPEEALAQVHQELGDDERERAVDALIGAYNEQSRGDADKPAPIRSHVLSGQSAFFNNVAGIVGVKGIDPLALDILGEAGAARVMASAIAQKFATDPRGLEGVRRGLENDHIETQVRIAENGLQSANEKFEAAKNVDILPIEDMDSMLEGLSRNDQAIELHRQGREILGLALGRLQSAAALGEALGRLGKRGVGEDVQISLGAVGSADALKKAAALGLTSLDQKDVMSGIVQTPGEFDLFNDGKNKILIVHPSGVQKLAGGMAETKDFLDRKQVVEDIKGGKQDEANWLPQGFSDRPLSDVSRPDSLDVPRLECQLAVDDWQKGASMQDGVRRYIAQAIEAGQTPVNIGRQLRSEGFIQTNVPKGKEGEWHANVNAVIPQLNRVGAKTGEYQEHQRDLDTRMRAYHSQLIEEEAAKMGLSPQDADKYVSIFEQSLPPTRDAADLIHQVSLQDPRLRAAFLPFSDCERSDRRMIRDYAYEHILKGPNGERLDPKESETPIEALSPSERNAYQKWHELRQTGAAYETIQDALKDATAAQGGGLFDDAAPEAHPLAGVNLHDDDDVLRAARESAGDLGYGVSHVGLDPASGKYERSFVPGLELENGDPIADESRPRAAQKARERIHTWLRQKVMSELWGSQGAGDMRGDFDPEHVATASKRWTEYVANMGGEQNAYAAIRDHMKGDFASRFANGYQQRTGQPFRVAYVPVAFSDTHEYASLPPDKRANFRAMQASERAQIQNRSGGKFGRGGVKEGLEAKKANDAMSMAIFDNEEGKKAVEERGTHRVTLGNAAENTIAGMLPNMGLRAGTSAAGDINMSRGNAIKRQRAIKLIKSAKRMQMSLGVGSGKTSVAQGAFSDLQAEGKVKRALMAVPSVVQEQFGSEAARFYDPTAKHMPTWFSDSTASTAERRASYHRDSGHDICVVTHQSLRDDLTWAVAENHFGGDTSKASDFLENAPEGERNRAVKDACSAQGWDFDMSVVDEGHNLLNRSGKANSAMANVIDAFTHDKEYHVPMSADPVKNDASEAFDLLRKVAPNRYVNDDHELAQVGENGLRSRGIVTRAEFLRKYNTNTLAAKEALAREMAPFHYAESLPPDVKTESKTHVIPMTPPQTAAYRQVQSMYQRARGARLKGGVDVDAIKHLSPSSFQKAPPEEHEDIARRLTGSLGILRDTAFDRVVNLHPQGAKMEFLLHRLGLKDSKTMGELGVEPQPIKDHPPIVFAHNLAAVAAIQKALEARGVSVARLDGTMSGEEKEKAKVAFSPQWDSATGGYATPPTCDCLIASDAGAVGWNGQRANMVINYDTPHTACTLEQRNGRSVRTGQRSPRVYLDTVMTDTPYEHARRKRQQFKGAIREAMTTPAELIDDSGLALRIARETDIARGRLVNEAGGSAPLE